MVNLNSLFFAAYVGIAMMLLGKVLLLISIPLKKEKPIYIGFIMINVGLLLAVFSLIVIGWGGISAY